MIKKTLGYVAIAILLSGLVVLSAAAQPTSLSDQQLEQIKTNCLSVKNTLNQLHASDALLRVNRGQTYESISTKLMDGFNNRVSGNNYNNSGLTSITTGYSQALDTFRSDYKTYEEHLSTAIGIDCSSRPADFYYAVDAARGYRNQVHADVVKLNQSISQYQSAIDQFETFYKGVNQ